MTNELQTLVDNFMGNFEAEPAKAEAAITMGLSTLANGDEDVYLNLRTEAASMIQAQLEANLRAEIAENAVEAVDLESTEEVVAEDEAE